MYPIPGHLALTIAPIKIKNLPYTPAICATFVVDIVDKIVKDIFNLAPYGRCWGHTLLSVVVCTLFVYKFFGKENGLSWMIGHFTHLIGDIGFIPWFYPFINYAWPDALNIVSATTALGSELIAGTTRPEGWLFSDLVKQVFKVKLLVLEMIMLISIGTIIYLDSQKKLKKIVATSLWITFVVTTVFSLAYQFPSIITYVSLYLGDWIMT